MSNTHQKSRAGQAHGEGVAKADKWVGSATGSVQAHRSDAVRSAHETKEQAAGFPEQTGGQVKQMPQGAVDTVKNTLGVGDNNSGNRT